MPSDRDQRFPRAARLRRSAEFQRVYKQGIRIAGRHVVLFAMQAEDTGRFGVTASRRIGNAVIRARSRRRFRELYRLRRSSTLVKSLDLVANARQGCAGVPWLALERDFDHCLERVKERMRTARR